MELRPFIFDVQIRIMLYARQENINSNCIIQVLYVLTWAFLASYYFQWGANEENVALISVDESGWTPDGTFAKEVVESTTT